MSKGVILTIDVTDPSGGTGINAATKTAAALGGYAQAVVTGVTVQTPAEVLGVSPMSPAVVADQIRAAFSSYPIEAILIGLLPNKEIIDTVADAIELLNPRPPIIVDPILCSRAGKKFLDKVAVDALKRRILVMADLLLPNVAEAESLTSLTISDEQTLEHAAEMLLTYGPRNVFIKGDALANPDVIEIYIDERRTQVFNRERGESTKRVHGAGATLAAAVTTLVALGNTPRESVTQARLYVDEAIKKAPDFGVEIAPVGHVFR